MGNGKGLLLVVALIALRKGLDVSRHGFVDAVDAWRDLASALVQGLFRAFSGPFQSSCHTFMAHGHFRFHGLEIIGEIGLHLAAHTLAGPLLEATDALVDIHGGCGGGAERSVPIGESEGNEGRPWDK